MLRRLGGTVAPRVGNLVGSLSGRSLVLDIILRELCAIHSLVNVLVQPPSLDLREKNRYPRAALATWQDL